MCVLMYKYSKYMASYLKEKVVSGKDCSKNIPKRFILAILGFLGCVNLYTMRVNLNVAIVIMVSHNHSKTTGLEYEDACPELTPEFAKSNRSVLEPERQGEFEWDSRMQGLILGSFFYGYVLTQIPGGYFAGKYRAKWILGFGILITSILTLLTPIAAKWSVWALVCIRVIEGLGSGVAYPSMITMIGRWAPVMERSRISTFIFSGGFVGSVISMMLSGILCKMNFLGGWPLVFYVFGTLGCVWFIMWMVFVDESPHTHPNISKEELQYIKQGQERTLCDVPVPWKSLMSSAPFWAVIIAFIAIDWGCYTLLLELPTYLSNIFHIDIAENGALSALPSLLSCVGSLSGAVIADYQRAKGHLRITTIRKILTSIGTFAPAIFILIIAHTGCQPSLILTLFALAMGFNGAVFSGVMVSHIDMSPAHAGILFGIANTAGNMSGFLVPSYVGWIIRDEHTVSNWRKVFVTSSIMYIISGIIYILFGSSELQTWGKTSLLSEDEDFKHKKILSSTKYSDLHVK